VFKQAVATVAGIASISLAIGGCTHKAPPAAKGPTIAIITPPALARTWEANLKLRNNNTITALHVVDQYLFAYTSDNQSFVFDRNAGTRVHISRINGQPKTPVVMKDFIVYPTNKSLEIYNRQGRFVRSIDLGSTPRTGAVTAAGRVAIGIDSKGRGEVLFVDVSKQGGAITSIMTMGALTSTPATRGGLTFVGSEDGKVYAISEELVAAWGTEGGTFKTDGPIVADLAADPGPTGANVYVPSTDTKLYAINAISGELNWQFYAGAPLTTGPTVTDDSVYIYVPGKGLAAIDKTTGGPIRQAKWTVRDATKLLADDDRFAYVLGINNRVYGVDKATGKVAFVSTRGDLRIFGQNSTDSTVYTATRNGEVIAAAPVLKPGTMGELVQVRTGETPVAAVVGK
jgi:hypothetical protein